MLAPTVGNVIVVMSKPRIIFLNRYSVHGLFRALSYRKAKIKVIAMLASFDLVVPGERFGRPFFRTTFYFQIYLS